MTSHQNPHWTRSLPQGLAALVFVLLLAPPLQAQSAGGEVEFATSDAADVSVVYLVRHAERADDDPRDPSLSPEGEARVIELVRVLADVPLTSVHSTPFRRTRSTAGPVAEAHGLQVMEYDPIDPAATAAFVGMLATTPGHHLVSGHSNTTPEMVAALGGDPGTPIDHAEYDRLYIVTVRGDGAVTTSLLRFGAPFMAEHQPEG